MKCPIGGGDVKAQDQKIAAFGSSYTGRAAFLQTKKRPCKARPFLILVPRGRLELWSAGAILSCERGGVAKIYSHFYSQQLPLLLTYGEFSLFIYAATSYQRLLSLNKLAQSITKQYADANQADG